MAHVHKVARHVGLLRSNPAQRAPQLHVNETKTTDDVRLWRQRARAFDDALVRLKIRTPAEITEENTRACLNMKESRVVKYSDYAGFSSRSLRKEVLGQGPLRIEVLNDVHGLKPKDLEFSAIVTTAAGQQVRLLDSAVLLKGKISTLFHVGPTQRPSDERCIQLLIPITRAFLD